MKVSELGGDALALWVAKALGCKMTGDGGGLMWVSLPDGALGGHVGHAEGGLQWRPHQDWAQGGPIIEREDICIMRPETIADGPGWVASRGLIGIVEFERDFGWYPGPTPLVAAMRAFVASKCGAEVPD